MKLIFRTAWAAIALAITIGCQTRVPAPRYLYLVSCDARVDKLDTVADRKLTSNDLRQVSGTPPAIPPAAGGFDGCLAYDAQLDVSSSTFYLIAPVQASIRDDGTKDYRILGFSLTPIQMIKTIPDGTRLTEPPHLDLRPDGVPRAIPDSAWRPPTDIDLSTYSPDRKKLGNQILESSGDRALVRIFMPDPDQLELAVVNTKSRTVARLPSAPPTTARNAHLSPEGDLVLVEVVEGGDQPKKTGKIVLFDGNTGKQVREISVPAIRDQYFLAISPSGKAIYYSEADYSFVNLNREFAPRPVTRVLDTSHPAYFFAGR